MLLYFSGIKFGAQEKNKGTEKNMTIGTAHPKMHCKPQRLTSDHFFYFSKNIIQCLVCVFTVVCKELYLGLRFIPDCSARFLNLLLNVSMETAPSTNQRHHFLSLGLWVE